MKSTCVTGLALGFALMFTGAFATPLATPLVIGEQFELRSEVLDETRTINVFRPTVYGEPVEEPLPVLYMPDGGLNEDFLHVAGLLQLFVSNGSMRPLLLVGIPNTERRRDLTGPTDDPEDRAIAPRVGGSERFRQFLRTELFPEIERRYPVNEERAIIGESLAGLFVVETLLREPAMFDTYIAVDPSVWWNRYALSADAAKLVERNRPKGKQLFIAGGREASEAGEFRDFVERMTALRGITVTHVSLQEETHATVYHPAVIKAFRTVFSPADEGR